MFQPKLIVTDLDGTALRNNKTISEPTRNAFIQCEKAGIPIAIATARYIGGAMPFAEALHARFQILTDGTLVYENGTLIYSNAMDIATTNAIIQELKRLGCTSHIAIPTTKGLFRYPEGSADGKDGWHFSLEKPFSYPGNKMVVELPSENIATEIAQKCHCSQFRYRGENRYTFYSTTASKLDAIEHITQRLGITLKDVLVFGDDINDMEMITHCGYGVAMGNALEQVKTVADEVTENNEKDGIVTILSRYYK